MDVINGWLHRRLLALYNYSARKTWDPLPSLVAYHAMRITLHVPLDLHLTLEYEVCGLDVTQETEKLGRS